MQNIKEVCVCACACAKHLLKNFKTEWKKQEKKTIKLRRDAVLEQVTENDRKRKQGRWARLQRRMFWRIGFGPKGKKKRLERLLQR